MRLQTLELMLDQVIFGTKGWDILFVRKTWIWWGGGACGSVVDWIFVSHPPEFIWWNSIPQFDGLRWWSLWEVIRIRSNIRLEASWLNLCPCESQKRVSSPFLLSAMWGSSACDYFCQEVVSSLQLRRGPSSELNHVGTLIQIFSL